jgi:hypothetical protein
MKKAALCFIILCFGCTHRSKAPVARISLVNNNQSVKFTGLDGAIMGEINRDSVPDIWQNLLPVYRMPADTDLKDYQPVQHGVYKLTGNAVVFTPDTPFAAHKSYFMRYYQFEGGTNIWDFIKGKKKLRGTRYVDLVFN